MKKLISILTSATLFFLFTSLSNAQTINEVIEVFNKGAEAMNSGDYENAITHFKECIKLSEEVGPEADDRKIDAENLLPGIYYNIALQAYKSKDYTKAIENIEEAANTAAEYNDETVKEKSEKYIPQFYYAYGNEYYKNDDFTNAEFNYKKAIEKDPEYINAYFRLGLICKKRDDEQKMAEYMDKCIEIGPSASQTVQKAKKVNKNYYVNNGKTAISNKNYTDAATALETSLTYDDADADVYYFLAVSDNNINEYNKAIEAANKALQLEKGTDEDKAKIYYELGNANKELGNADEACSAYKSAEVGKFLEAAKYQREQVLKCQ